jgi:hypothetical protein
MRVAEPAEDPSAAAAVDTRAAELGSELDAAVWTMGAEMTAQPEQVADGPPSVGSDRRHRA